MLDLALSVSSVPVTGAGARAVSAAWSPLALWPDGIASPGMWISPRDLTSQWQDYTGTTPVVEPGTVADSSNPVGLALDIRAGAPTTLGPELVTNGDFATSITGWDTNSCTLTWVAGDASVTSAGGGFWQEFATVAGIAYKAVVLIVSGTTQLIAFQGGGLSVTLASEGGAAGARSATVTFVAATTASRIYVKCNTNAVVSSISVREVPGNHMLQATSTARPMVSARRNLLTYTEDFSDAEWTKGSVTVSTNATTAPDGTVTADLITESSTNAYHYIQKSAPGFVAGVGYVAEVYAKYAGRRYLRVMIYNGASTPFQAVFDIQNGLLGSYVGGGATRSIISVGNGWYRLCCVGQSNSSVAAGSLDFALQDADESSSYIGDGTSGVYLWGAQLHTGPTALPYQRVGAASDYTTTGFPAYLKFDGTDDGMATASFAAGTLSNNMDCLIAVRRDSAGNAVCGLYESVAEANKVFGIAESGSGSGCVGSGAGTPTVWVDGVQLTGGTAVTRGTLHTALTVGDYHVLEFRGLDLSTWTASGFGLYTSYVLNGAQGGILLFPGGDTAKRDAARAWLAAKVGLTL